MKEDEKLEIKALLNQDIRDLRCCQVVYVVRNEKTEKDRVCVLNLINQSEKRLVYKFPEGVQIRDVCYRNGLFNFLDSKNTVHKFKINKHGLAVSETKPFELFKQHSMLQTEGT